jgi:hypothetical protein
LQLPRPAFQQRSPVSDHEVYLVFKQAHRRFRRVLLQRDEAIPIISRILDSIMRGDLENINQLMGVSKDRRALRREVLLNVDGRAEE